MANVGTVLINIKARSDEMMKGLKKARMRLRRFRKSLNRTFGGIAKMATVAGGAILGGLGAALTVAVGIFSSFEQKMADVQSIIGKNNEQFGEMEALARKLGSTTAFTATQAAEAMELMSRAGFTANETMAATVHVMNLAAASGHTLAEMADVVAKAIRGFGLESAEAARVADVLALASAKSNTTVNDLGTALSYVAPIAKSLNMDLEETVAMLGLLSDAGMQADKAGTALRSVLATLVDQVGDGGLLPVIKKLADEGLGTAEAFAQFGKKGAPAILTLIAMQKAGVDLDAALNDATGTTKEMAEIRLDTLQGAFALLRSAAEEAMIVIGERVAPIIRLFAEGLTVAVQAGGQAFDSMVGSTKSFSVSISDVVGGVATFIEGLGYAVDFANRFFNVFKVGFLTVKSLLLGFIRLMIRGSEFTVQAWAWGLNAIGVLSDEMYDGMIAGMEGFTQSIDEQITETTKSLGDAFGNIFAESDVRPAMDEFARRLRRGAHQIMNDTGESLGEEIVEGVKEGVQGLAVVITEEMEALADATEDVQDFIKTTQEAIDTWGMNADQILIWKARQKGVSEELLKQAEALMEQKKALEAQQKAMERGKQITEQMRTPSEIYADTIKELDDLLKRGAITQETFTRAMAKAKEDLASATDIPEIELKANITGVDTALGQFNVGMDLGDQLAKKQLSAEEKQVKLLGDIANSVKDGGSGGVLT